jgi:hypothetical protein
VTRPLREPGYLYLASDGAGKVSQYGTGFLRPELVAKPAVLQTAVDQARAQQAPKNRGQSCQLATPQLTGSTE